MADDAAASLLERRRTALLDRWAAGKRLTDDELQVIADLLPKTPEPPPVLQLEAQVEGKSEKKYQKQREDYAPSSASRSRRSAVGRRATLRSMSPRRWPPGGPRT